MKFKVGDKVRRIKHEGFNVKRWDICTVRTVEQDHLTVEEEHDGKGYYFTLEPSYFELVETSTQAKDEAPIKSDGGSSAYYFTKLPQHIIDKIVETGGIEIKDIVRYVYDNNADAFNIIKAQKRIIESRKGKGKEGIDMLYDANKIKFFAEEQYSSILQEGKE